MKRIDYIRTMSVNEMVKIIIEEGITDEYCKGDCEECEAGEGICYSEIEKQCAIRWLNEEMEENNVK